MDIIVNHSSMQPIYEQIGDQIKEKIMHGILKADTPLPSVRTLAKELKVSALTVKKAYDALEEEGFVITIHGKGSFVAFADQGLVTHAVFSPLCNFFTDQLIERTSVDHLILELST